LCHSSRRRSLRFGSALSAQLAELRGRRELVVGPGAFALHRLAPTAAAIVRQLASTASPDPICSLSTRMESGGTLRVRSGQLRIGEAVIILFRLNGE
jgi:hypothetical protein